LLWIVENTGSNGADSSFSYISLTHHITPLLRGMVSSVDVVYFSLFIITFLILTIRQMDAERLQG